MKLAKIYIIIFVVTAFSLFGADCGGQKNNVSVSVDTSSNKVISNKDFMKINQNLKIFGVTFEQMLEMNSASGKFSFFIFVDLESLCIYVI